MRTTRRTRWRTAGLLTGAALAWSPGVVLACETCFGAAGDSPTTRAIGLAMLSLLLMTGAVGSGIGAFFINMRRRARQYGPGRYVVTDRGELAPAAATEADEDDGRNAD